MCFIFKIEGTMTAFSWPQRSSVFHTKSFFSTINSLTKTFFLFCRTLLQKIWSCKPYNAGKSSSKSSGVDGPARMGIKTKRTNKHTKQTNCAFLRGNDPLPALITLWHQKGHTQNRESAEGVRMISALSETKQPF